MSFLFPKHTAMSRALTCVLACAAGTYDDGSDTCATQPSDASCPGATDITGCTCDTGFTGDGTATCTGELLSLLSVLSALLLWFLALSLSLSLSLSLILSDYASNCWFLSFSPVSVLRSLRAERSS